MSETPHDPAKVREDVEAKNVANILTKLQSGKVLTQAEKQQVLEWADAKKPAPASVHEISLNPRQREFVKLLATGARAVDAYKAVYGPKKGSPHHVGSSAHKMTKNPRILAALLQLRRKTDAKTLLTINDRLAILTRDAMTTDATPAARNARARTLEVYSKLAGDMGPERQELSGPGGGPIPVSATLAPVQVLTQTTTVKQRIEMMRAARAANKAADDASRDLAPQPQPSPQP